GAGRDPVHPFGERREVGEAALQPDHQRRRFQRLVRIPLTEGGAYQDIGATRELAGKKERADHAYVDRRQEVFLRRRAGELERIDSRLDQVDLDGGSDVDARVLMHSVPDRHLVEPAWMGEAAGQDPWPRELVEGRIAGEA